LHPNNGLVRMIDAIDITPNRSNDYVTAVFGTIENEVTILTNNVSVNFFPIIKNKMMATS